MIRSELQMLVASFLFGVGIIISYGLVDLLRKFLGIKKAALVIFELVYWSIAAVLAFRIQFCLNDGVLRMYSVMGAAVGLWMAHRLCGKGFEKLSFKAARMAGKRRIYRRKRKAAMRNRLKKYREQVKITLSSWVEQHEET